MRNRGSPLKSPNPQAIKPLVAGHGVVVLIHLSIAPLPLVIFAWRKPDPSDQEGRGQGSLEAPFPDEIVDENRDLFKITGACRQLEHELESWENE